MFKLPQEIKNEIVKYKSSLEELLQGKTNTSRFMAIRVPWGFYSHRGGKIFMSRIRIPAGELNSRQLKAISYVAGKFGNGIAHLTTRQDIQVHEVRIEDTLKVIEYLKDYELSSRGGGGNSVRNITSCPLAGICEDEAFDVRNYAIWLTEYLLAQESSFNLPRKFKIGFSGCHKDCAGCLTQDVGLLAEERNGKRGFRLFVGGGMGLESILGHLLEEFIPEEELGYSVSAIKAVFFKLGDRRNKHHNRLRFLIKDMGPDAFRSLYLEELKNLKESEYIALRKIAIPVPATAEEEIPDTKDAEFAKFLRYSVYTQKQRGLASIELRIPRGDVSCENLELLASLEKESPGIEYRTAQNQNIFLCNIRKSQVFPLYLKLKAGLKDFLYPSTLLDIVCCKGALTCNLGLCNSPGLSQEIEKLVAKNFIDSPAFRKLNIKINGCPNSCGQHPLGLVALHGVVRRVSGRPVPFYRLLLGGRKAAGETKLAKDTGILLPARNVPLFLHDFIGRINSDMAQDTDIHKYIEEKGALLAKEAADKYAYVPEYSQDRSFYIDWGKSEEFSLEGIGPGECGAGVLDMIDADLSDALGALEEARKKDCAASAVKKALFFSARALLVVKGIDPKGELEALRDFRDKFIQEGIADSRFSDLEDIYASLSALPAGKDKEGKFIYAQDFLEHINALYKSMDSSFNFPKQNQQAVQQAEKAGAILDLKGTPCPINYVKAKLFLEDVKPGDIVAILLDEGEPINNVPKSLENDGNKVLKIEKIDGIYKVVVKKGNQ